MNERTRIGRIGDKGFKADRAVLDSGGVSNTLLTTYDDRTNGKGFKVLVMEEGKNCEMVGVLCDGYESSNRVYSEDGISPTLTAICGGNQEKKVLVNEKTDRTICLNSKVDGKQPSLQDRVYSERGCSTACTTSTFFMGKAMTKWRIRKLTPYESGKLMGFDRGDFEAMEGLDGLSKTILYHSAGDSIVTTVLMGLFGELLGVGGYRGKIEAVADRIATQKGSKE